jgi:hypothetical protein
LRRAVAEDEARTKVLADEEAIAARTVEPVEALIAQGADPDGACPARD